jgi:Flp pilus assembly protein TadG
MMSQARPQREPQVLRKFLTRARGGAVTVMFAVATLPMIGLVGLAVDYGVWNQANSELAVAANVAALTAVKITANAQLAGDPNAVTEGTVAGQQWFQAEIGMNSKQSGGSKVGTTLVTLSPAGSAIVNVVGGTTVTATVQYSGTVQSIFGGLFYNLASYNIYGQAVSQVTSAPFLNIEIMLDNSGSMDIGATNADITALQEITPCQVAVSGKNAPGAYYINGGTPAAPTYSQGAGQSYSAFATSGYDGSATLPQPAPVPPLLPANYPGNIFIPSNAGQGPSCQGTGPLATPSYTTPWGTTAYPNAGPPCAFACHWDLSKAAGTGNDYFALARSTINTPNQITLRFDLVKNATSDVVGAMQTDNIPTLNNLAVGLFTFDNSLHRVYPTAACGTGPSCEAGDDWNTALSLIGAPPGGPNQADTGIQASNDGNGPGDSDFHDTMVSLSNQMTASGDGTKSTTPRKVLFIVSDGMADYTGAGIGVRTYSPVSPADCTLFKNLGFTVYVVFTPYYPVMNPFYYSNIKTYAEPLVGSKLYNAMQSCASSPSDFISATSQQELKDALNSFLKAALTTPARFTF